MQGLPNLEASDPRDSRSRNTCRIASYVATWVARNDDDRVADTAADTAASSLVAPGSD